MLKEHILHPGVTEVMSLGVEAPSQRKKLEERENPPVREVRPPGQIKIIGWDKDGTLVYQDFSRIAADQLNRRFSVPYIGAYRFLDQGFNEGAPLREMLRYLLTDGSAGRLICSPEIFRMTEGLIIREMKEAPPVLFPDVVPSLQKLHANKYRMFILSRHPEYLIRMQMKQLGIAHFFETFLGSSHKKGERGFKTAAKRMHVPYEEFRQELIYIGDTVYDAKSTREANVPFIGRNSYIGGPNYLGNKATLYDSGRAKLVVDNFLDLDKQLPTLLKTIDEPQRS